MELKPEEQGERGQLDIILIDELLPGKPFPYYGAENMQGLSIKSFSCGGGNSSGLETQLSLSPKNESNG